MATVASGLSYLGAERQRYLWSRQSHWFSALQGRALEREWLATVPHRPARKTGWKHRRHILQELFHATLLKLLDHFFDLGFVFFLSHQRRVRRMHDNAILHANGYHQVAVATAND